jgi:hypothetical protein
VRAFFKAERIIAGGRAFSVIHNDAPVLLALAQEADARFDSSSQAAVVVASGTIDTSTHGGA